MVDRTPGAQGSQSEKRDSESPSVSELRQYQRLPLAEDAAIFKLDAGFTVLGNCDISEGGVCFYSDHQFKPGRRMKLNIKNMLGVEIEVVRCEMEMTDDTFMEAKYKVAAEFVSGPIDEDLYHMLLQSLGE